MTCKRVILELLDSEGVKHIVLIQDQPNNPIVIDLHLNLIHTLEKDLGVRRASWLYELVS
jgi:hypothetical protein